MEQEPIFLTREQIEEVHHAQIEEFGGIHGLRDVGALESAISQPINVYLYGDRDLFEIAGAYAFHIAQSQAYLDGNKRTAMQAALVFLEINDIDTNGLSEIAAFDAMIAIAKHEMDRPGLAQFFRESLGSWPIAADRSAAANSGTG